jgi:hypothetical protein
MKIVLLPLGLAGASQLNWESNNGPGCAITYDGTELSTTCALGSTFNGGAAAGLALTNANVQEVNNTLHAFLNGEWAAHNNAGGGSAHPPHNSVIVPCTDVATCGYKSCTDLAKVDDTLADGTYKLKVDGMLVDAYCQFDHAEYTAWTLVTSWRLDADSNFNAATFGSSTARNQDDPTNVLYRLDFPRMAALRTESTMWKSSCNMDNSPTRDFVQAKFIDLDPLSFSGGGVCKKMMKVCQPASVVAAQHQRLLQPMCLLLLYHV